MFHGLDIFFKIFLHKSLWSLVYSSFQKTQEYFLLPLSHFPDRKIYRLLSITPVYFPVSNTYVLYACGTYTSHVPYVHGNTYGSQFLIKIQTLPAQEEEGTWLSMLMSDVSPDEVLLRQCLFCDHPCDWQRHCPLCVCLWDTFSAFLLDEPANGKETAMSLSLGRDLRAPGLESSGWAGGSPVSDLLEVAATLLTSLKSYKVNKEIN